MSPLALPLGVEQVAREGLGPPNVLVIPRGCGCPAGFAMRVQAGATESWTPVGKSAACCRAAPREAPIVERSSRWHVCLGEPCPGPAQRALAALCPPTRRPEAFLLTHAYTRAISRRRWRSLLWQVLQSLSGPKLRGAFFRREPPPGCRCPRAPRRRGTSNADRAPLWPRR